MSKRKATIELENSRKPKVATSEKCHDALLSSLFGCIYGCECAVCTNSKNNMHTDNGYVQEKYLSDHVIDADMQRKEVIDANYDRGILALHFKTLSDNKLVNFAPKTAHDLCTCTWQTVIRSHHGPCSQTARASALICPNQSRHEMFKLIEGDTLYTYVPFYLNTETNYPMSSFANQNETFRRLNFIESLVLTNYLSSSSSILNAALPCKDLLTIITDYTVETPQICAEKWFVALPIKGARIVAKYAFVYLQNSQKDKEKDPYKPLPAVYHQSFRESVLRRFNEHDISLVKLMQQCLPIHFQMMTWQYQTMVAIPPSSQNSTNTFDDTECAKSFCIELQKWDMLCKKKPQIYLRRLNSLRNLLSTNENEDKIQTSRYVRRAASRTCEPLTLFS